MCTSSTSNRGNIVELLLLNWLSFVSPGRHPTWLQETDRNQRLDDYASAAAAAAEDVRDFEPFGRNLAFHHLSEDIAEEEDNDDNDNYDVAAFDELGRAGPAQSLEPTETFSRSDRSLLPEYRGLCESVTRKVDLKSDPNYEYQPSHYHEVFCKSYTLASDEPQKRVSAPSKQKCAHPSFHCVQRSRTLFMLRRRWDDAECWEPATKVIASGCECMWPVSSLGDIKLHY
uniref:Spaetzle domain-containing protein n=1 Tax=Trichogramma kaykai TaxID=54128 RepID=A0ABD2X223_9HYME